MPDPNMELAYQLSQIMDELPEGAIPANMAEFTNPEVLARFLDKHDAVIAKNLSKIFKALQVIVDSIEGRDPGMVLRLWSGCLTSAKIVALDTRDGPVTTNYRRSATAFFRKRCRRNPTWKAGYQAGPALKRIRGEQVCYDGIPGDLP